MAPNHHQKPSSERFFRTTTGPASLDDEPLDPKKPVSLRLQSTTIREGAGKQVGFDRIDIYEHAYELGDNPSVSDGAPLCIAWDAQHRKSYEIEYYESKNPSSKRRRAKSAKNGLRLSVSDRAQLLLSSGYSMVEIVGATLQVLELKQSREESVRNKKWDGVNAALENTTRTLKKVARRGSMLATAPVRMSRRGSMPSTVPTGAGDFSNVIIDPTSTNDETTTTSASNTKSRRNSIFGSVPLIGIADPLIDTARTA